MEKLISSQNFPVVTRSFNSRSYTYEATVMQEKLQSNLIVVAPFSFCRPEALIKAVKDNIIINEKTKIIMIDEIQGVFTKNI